MSKLKYKLIVSDLDGTLLNNKAQLTERTIEAIKQYHKAGGLFTYATGRTVESSQVFVERLGIKIPGIAFNGAKVVSYIDNRVIYETFLDGECAKKAYTAFRAHDKDVVVYFDDSRYVAEYTSVIDKYLERVRHSVIIVRNIEQVIGRGESLKKILVIDPKQEEELILGIVKPIFGENINYIKSDSQYYEFLAPGTSKGYALEALAKYLGISLDDTIAIGDHMNDISMINTAGLGVAVANAEQETIDAADYITTSNDNDGVALTIEKLLRGEL